MNSFFKFGFLTALARAVSVVSLMFYAKIAGPQMFGEFTLYLISVTAINSVITAGITPSIVRQLSEVMSESEEIDCLANYFATMLITLLIAVFLFQISSQFISNSTKSLNCTFFWQIFTLSTLIITRVLIEAYCHHYNKQIILPVSKLAEAATLSAVIFGKPESSPFSILFFSYFSYLLASAYGLVQHKVSSKFTIRPKISISAISANIRELSLLSMSGLVSASTIPNLLQREIGNYTQSVATFGLANQIHSLAIFLPATLNSFRLKKVMNKRRNDKKFIVVQIVLCFATPLVLLVLAFLFSQPIKNFYSQYENINNSIYLLIIAAIFHANSNTLNTYLLRENKAKAILCASIVYSMTAFTVYFTIKDMTVLRLEFSVVAAFCMSFIVKVLMLFGVNKRKSK